MMINFVPFTSDQQYADAGLTCKDIYQTQKYVSLEGAKINAAPYLFLYQSTALSAGIPVLVSEIPYKQLFSNTYADATSPYGYPGILFSKEPTVDEVDQLLDALIKCSFENNIVSLFIRLHPFYNQFTINNRSQMEQIVHGNTIYVDLTKLPDPNTTQYSTNHRRGIKQLLSAGYNVQINNWQDFGLFQSAYAETMEHVQAAPFYFFDKNYFEQLRSALKDHLHLISVYNQSNQFTCGALFTAFGDIVQYHLGGTLKVFRHDAPSKLIFDAAIRYFSKAKYKYLHLGGGLGTAEDELFRFKQGFSKTTWQFSTMRCITNPEIYHQLVETHQQKTTITGSNYFPLYRQQG